MPPQKAAERLILARVFVGIVVMIHRAWPRRANNHLNAGELELGAITASVLIGTVEGKPKTASGVARHLMMSRPTVLRKLAILERYGTIERVGRTYRTKDHPSIDFSYADDALALIRKELHNRK
jgi:hypothetical protein